MQSVPPRGSGWVLSLPIVDFRFPIGCFDLAGNLQSTIGIGNGKRPTRYRVVVLTASNRFNRYGFPKFQRVTIINGQSRYKMKSVRLILSLALLTVAANAQDKLPVIKSTVSVISIQDGERLKKNVWTLTPDVKPDVYEADLIEGKPHKVTFITDINSISFMVEGGKKYDFIIQRGDDLCYTQIVGKRFVPAAVFNKKYRAEHKGKMLVEFPKCTSFPLPRGHHALLRLPTVLVARYRKGRSRVVADLYNS